jgi:carbonic anhydrase/acetyltransferase-like protein (isoleucine patch superfamily)
MYECGDADDGVPVRVRVCANAGHGAALTSCTVQDKALVGIGAVVGEGALVEEGAQLAAGAVVPPGGRIPKGEVRAWLWLCLAGPFLLSFLLLACLLA